MEATCDNNSEIQGWDVGALVLQMATCFFGAIGCGLSLMCLLPCQRIQTGMKIQLGLFFFILLTVCVVGMPAAVLVEFGSLRCWQIDRMVKVGFVALYTICVALERNIFATMAVYRLVAVCFPQKYKLVSQWAVVVAVEVVLCVSVIALWMPTFLLQDTKDVDVNNPTTYRAGYALYLVLFLLPIFISVLAYFFLFAVMIARRQKAEQQNGRRSSWNDQVNFAVGVLIMTNLLLDVPHITVHLSGAASSDLSFVFIHVIYRLHVALDPFIFIALNSHYRRRVLRLLFSRIPACSGFIAEQVSTTVESSSRRPDSVGPKGHPMYSTCV